MATSQSVPLPFDIDHDLEQAKAFVRLRQAAVPVPEAFFTLRVGALILRTIGGAILVLSLAAAIVFMLSDVVERTLDIPGSSVAIVTIIVGGGMGLFVLVVGELLIIQVVIARNTRLTTVILSEMNFAEASAREDLANRLTRSTPASAGASSAAPTPPSPAQRWPTPETGDPSSTI